MVRLRMTKYFCDGCEVELNEHNSPGGGKNSGRLEATVGKNGRTLKVEVIHSQDGCANAGMYCKHCILDALNELDDRLKAS